MTVLQHAIDEGVISDPQADARLIAQLRAFSEALRNQMLRIRNVTVQLSEIDAVLEANPTI